MNQKERKEPAIKGEGENTLKREAGMSRRVGRDKGHEHEALEEI